MLRLLWSTVVHSCCLLFLPSWAQQHMPGYKARFARCVHQKLARAQDDAAPLMLRNNKVHVQACSMLSAALAPGGHLFPAARRMHLLNMQVILNDRVDGAAGASGGPFTGSTRGGVKVDCDMLLAATGITVNSDFIKPHLADALDQHGRIKVSA